MATETGEIKFQSRGNSISAARGRVRPEVASPFDFLTQISYYCSKDTSNHIKVIRDFWLAETSKSYSRFPVSHCRQKVNSAASQPITTNVGTLSEVTNLINDAKFMLIG
jgi:hypothetical protein